MKFCLICLWKNAVVSQKVTWRKSFKAISTNQETGCQWQITSAFAWCCLRWPWAACFATARSCGRKQRCFLCHCLYACMRQNCFCLVFGKKFNIISALFIHQPLAMPQIIDSRAGLFRCKLGLVCEYSKMNFYLKRLSFAPAFGLFAAKCSAICC